MSFADPVWLYLIPILLLFFGSIIAYGLRKRSELLSRFAAGRLLDQLTEKASLSRTWVKAVSILIAASTIGLALARPQFGVEWSERKARSLDIVFIIDSSKSMLATDLRPTRLDRAKLAVLDLVERLESDRIGLVAFAGQAFLQTPPTLDFSAFRESLDSISPSIMSSGGSDIGYALEESAKAFPTENNVKVAVMLTDGEDLGGKVIEAANAAREAGIQVFAIGIGTPEGEYLRIKNAHGIEEFVRDSSGQPVLSKLDESSLQQVAQITGGSYSRLSGDSLDQLYNSVIATLPREERQSELQEIRIERFQWAISAALIFLVLDILIRRRRQSAISVGLIFLAATTTTPSDLKAKDEPKLDARKLYNEAYQALSDGDFQTAQALYEASVSAGSETSLQGNALYNLGHTQYQQGLQIYPGGDPQGALEQIKEAEALFESAQDLTPSTNNIDQDLESIRQVRDAIEKLLEQQQEQEQSDENNDSEDSEKNEDQEENSEEGEDSEGESGEQDQEQSEEQESQEDSEQQSDQPGEDSQDQSDESQSESSREDDESEDQGSASADEEETGEESDEENPQPEPGEEGSEEEGSEEEEAAIPEPSEGKEEEGGNPAPGQIIEGMSAQDAAALLDSLRSKETLLPFIDQPRGGHQREIRDW